MSVLNKKAKSYLLKTFIVRADSELECEKNVDGTPDLLFKLDFVIHSDESILNSTLNIEFLGFMKDSANMTICETT